MKKTELKGVTLYEKKDTLPEKFTRESIGRLTVGDSYKVLGPCHVEETTRRDGTKINAWDGILVQNTATAKQSPVSVNVMQGIGFIKDEDGNWKVVNASVQAFSDAKSVADYRGGIKVIGIEKLTVQEYEKETTINKNYYHFEKVAVL